MLGLSRRWIICVVAVAAVKAALATLTPLGADFITFLSYASMEYRSLSHGIVSFHGVYTGLALLLAPFFWLWNAIPVAHPQASAMLGLYYFHPSLEAFLLTFVMKLPILVFDALAGVFVFFLVRDITGSHQSGGKAFLFWYLNPFNVFMIELWGSMDVIPAAFVVLAVLLALRKRWIFSGLSLSLATLLRIFPLLLLPAFLLYWIRKCSNRITVGFMIVFLAPLVAALSVLLLIFGSVEAIVSSFVGIAFGNAWLLRFYGIIIVPGIQGTFDRLGMPLALFLYPLQLYVAVSLWKRHRIDKLVLAFLLVHFTATTYEPYHFTWITPMLAAFYGIDRRHFRLLAVLLVTAFVSMYTYADVSALGGTFSFIPLFTPAIRYMAFTQHQLYVQLHPYVPLFMGIFHGVLGVFLIKLNLEEVNPAIARQMSDSKNREPKSFLSPRFDMNGLRSLHEDLPVSATDAWEAMSWQHCVGHAPSEVRTVGRCKN